VSICHLTDFALLGSWVSISDVSIESPTTGQMSSSYAFTATVNPSTPTTSITYTWEATNKTPVVHTEQGINDNISFTWNLSGTKCITVTASNVSGSTIATHTVTIREGRIRHLSAAGGEELPVKQEGRAQSTTLLRTQKSINEIAPHPTVPDPTIQNGRYGGLAFEIPDTYCTWVVILHCRT
jgi:hypothetical protein